MTQNEYICLKKIQFLNKCHVMDISNGACYCNIRYPKYFFSLYLYMCINICTQESICIYTIVEKKYPGKREFRGDGCAHIYKRSDHSRESCEEKQPVCRCCSTERDLSIKQFDWRQCRSIEIPSGPNGLTFAAKIYGANVNYIREQIERQNERGTVSLEHKHIYTEKNATQHEQQMKCMSHAFCKKSSS